MLLRPVAAKNEFVCVDGGQYADVAAISSYKSIEKHLNYPTNKIFYNILVWNPYGIRLW